MTKEELDKIIENHQHWIHQDCEGWGVMRAYLCGANLYNADLHGVNLYGAILSGANLYNADLHGVNLYGAILSGANLYCANLQGSILYSANLCNADLHYANLQGSILYSANLCNADLRYANLYMASMIHADLCGAYLSGANLCNADLPEAKNVPFVPYACPEFGSFIGFKKARGYIVMLEIPEDAKRLSATSLKCRCDKAKVLEIQNIDGSASKINEVPSDYNYNFIYKVGEMASVNNFDENRWNECSTGIHFFINRQNAVEY